MVSSLFMRSERQCYDILALSHAMASGQFYNPPLANLQFGTLL